MVGARSIKPARDRIERSVVFATREVFKIFIRAFGGWAAYNEYPARRHPRNTKFSGFDISRGDSFMPFGHSIHNGLKLSLTQTLAVLALLSHARKRPRSCLVQIIGPGLAHHSS